MTSASASAGSPAKRTSGYWSQVARDKNKLGFWFILPIFLLILTGYVFKRYGFPGDGFWVPAEKLAYFVLLPVLIVLTAARRRGRSSCWIV